MKKSFLLSSLLLACLGCGNASSGGELSREDLREIIITEVLKERCVAEIDSGTTLVINAKFSAEGLKFSESTSEFSTSLIQQSQKFGERYVEAARDFVLSNFENSNDGAMPKLPFPYVLHSKQEKAIAGNAVRDFFGWKDVLRKYPDTPGFISLSEPGISEDGSIAMIYLEMSKLKGKGCSGGNLYVFEFIAGEWVRVEDKLSIGWVS